jgi:hypothetical protein
MGSEVQVKIEVHKVKESESGVCVSTRVNKRKQKGWFELEFVSFLG